MTTAKTAVHLHGPAAELLGALRALDTGDITVRELLDTVHDLRCLNQALSTQDPHALHLYAMACEELGLIEPAIDAYAEAAIQLSLIEDPTREAAAYTALARQHYLRADIDNASRAAAQAMFLYLHLGDTPKLAVHRLYDFCLRTAKTRPDILNTPSADQITATISRYTRTATALYTAD